MWPFRRRLQPPPGPMARKIWNDLREYEEIGATHVIFCSSRDERNTPLENKLEGNEMSIAEARKILSERGDEIPRSTFRAILKW